MPELSWTQPVCLNKFKELYPESQPYQIGTPNDEELEGCCFCRIPTPIYVRIDPATVPFPREE